MDGLRIPDLGGKAVLITGASTGIGAALARAFAAQGAWVGLHYNASVAAAELLGAEITAAGGRVALIRADMSARRGRARGRGPGTGGLRAAGRADQQCGRHGAPGGLCRGDGDRL